MATEIKATMEGKWIVCKSENFENYLDALGIGTIKKKLACSLTPKLKLLVTGDTINASISAGPKKNKTAFKLGEQYDVDANDVPSTAVSTWQDKKLITMITPKDPKRKMQIVEREIIDGEMVQTMTVEHITARRFFKKHSDIDR